MLLFALACESVPDSDTGAAAGETGDSGGATACPDPGSQPAATAWAASGVARAGGLSTLATNGSFPVYAGSALSGIWRLDAATDAEFAPLRVAQTTHTLGDLIVSPEDPLRIYRSAGGVLDYSVDGGDEWRITEFGSLDEAAAFPGHLYGVGLATASPGRVYGLLDTGVFGVSTDGGDEWEARGLIAVEGGADDFIDYYRRFRVAPGRDGTESILVHDGRNLWRSTDDGWTWQAVFADEGTPSGLARNPADPDDVRFVDKVSHDGGETWGDAGGSAQIVAWGDSLLTVDGAELTLTSPERGTQTVALPSAAVSAVGGVGPDLFALADTEIWHSADAGGSWSRYEHSNIEQNFSVAAVHPSCPGVVWVGTRCDSGVYRTEDWGSTWERVNTHGHYVMDIVFDPARAGRVWLVTDDMLMRSEDDGASWENVWQKYHFHGFALDPLQPGRLLVGSVGSGNFADTLGQIYVSTDDGESFVPTEGIPPNESSAHTFVFLDDDVALAGFYKAGDESHLSGEGIGLYRSTDRGLTWSLTGLPMLDVAHVTSGAGAAWAAGGGGVYRSFDLGITWEQVVGGTARWVDIEGEAALALLDNETIMMSTDGGDTWSPDRESDPPPSPLALENPLSRVVIAPGGEVAWWTRYGEGMERRVGFGGVE